MLLASLYLFEFSLRPFYWHLQPTIDFAVFLSVWRGESINEYF